MLSPAEPKHVGILLVRVYAFSFSYIKICSSFACGGIFICSEYVPSFLYLFVFDASASSLTKHSCDTGALHLSLSFATTPGTDEVDAAACLLLATDIFSFLFLSGV